MKDYSQLPKTILEMLSEWIPSSRLSKSRYKPPELTEEERTTQMNSLKKSITDTDNCIGIFAII